MAGGALTHIMCFLYPGTHFVLGKLRCTRLNTCGQNTTGCHELETVDSLLQVEPGRLAHLVRAITFETDVPAMPACHSDKLTRTEKARPLHITRSKGIAQGKLGPFIAAQVA